MSIPLSGATALALSLCFVTAVFAATPEKSEGEDRSSARSGNVDLPKGFIKESPLPQGYPGPSEPGKVVEKTYPLSRTFSAEGRAAFWHNFRYLKKQGHAMTTPVIMPYDPSAEKASRGMGMPPVPYQRMHFVLERLQLDEPKKSGPVTVADMPKLRVVSIAIRGNLDAKTLAAAEAKLRDYLKTKPQLGEDGPPRILGYNSPMVRSSKRYWEVQIPVATK